ncbi:Syntaxin-71 [Bienertia sinuspersici]
MSLVDIITRVDTICNKYEKYDVEKHREFDASGDDAFARFYSEFQSKIDAIVEKSDAASSEKNRASAVALFADVRRTKARLLQELPKLHKLANKKVKGLSRDELEARSDLVSALKERIEAIPDGTPGEPKKTGGWAASSSTAAIKIDSDSEGWTSTGMKVWIILLKDWTTLKDMAQALNEELDKQEPLMDEIGSKADRATSDLRNTNVRLKDTVNKLRSSRNFCLDIILLSIILGIAAYLYNVLK